MSRTTLSGPIKAGTIQAPTGTTVGEDVANVGYGVCVQTDYIEHGDTSAKDLSIYLPENTQILTVEVLVEEVFNDSTPADNTFSLGDSGSINRYVNSYGSEAVRTDGYAATQYPLKTVGNWIVGGSGSSSEQMQAKNWYNVTTASSISGDIRLRGKVDGTATSGKCRVNVMYIPGRNLAAPVAWGS